MDIIGRKPYLISWLGIPVLVLVDVLFRQHSVNIQLADTYFVISNLHFVLVGSLFLLLIGVGYWLLSRKDKTPNQVLTAIHVLITLGILIIYALPLSESNLVPSDLLVWGAIVFLFGQLLYGINLITTLFDHT